MLAGHQGVPFPTGSALTSPKLMRLACLRISVSPRRSFIFRYLGGQGTQQAKGCTACPAHPTVPA